MESLVGYKNIQDTTWNRTILLEHKHSFSVMKLSVSRNSSSRRESTGQNRVTRKVPLSHRTNSLNEIEHVLVDAMVRKRQIGRQGRVAFLVRSLQEVLRVGQILTCKLDTSVKQFIVRKRVCSYCVSPSNAVLTEKEERPFGKLHDVSYSIFELDCDLSPVTKRVRVWGVNGYFFQCHLSVRNENEVVFLSLENINSIIIRIINSPFVRLGCSNLSNAKERSFLPECDPQEDPS
jgi:hypothetical protein